MSAAAETAVLNRVTSRMRRVWQLLRHGEITMVMKSVRRLLWSESAEYGMRRDLSRPMKFETTEVDFTVKPLRPEEFEEMLAVEAEEAPLQVWRLRRLHDAGIPTCWVAMDADDEPCFVMWVVGPESNDRMRQEMGPWFRPLADDEVLLESGFTPVRYRGHRVGLEAGKRILSVACPEARWAWAFTAEKNRAALTTLVRAGSEPALKVRTKWRFLRQTVEFEPVPADEDVLARFATATQPVDSNAPRSGELPRA